MATSCLSALSVLLERTLRDGEDIRYISDGIELLISGQTDILKNRIAALNDAISQIRAEKFELRNLDEVATMHGVRRELVRTIVSSAVGVRLEAIEAGGENAAA